MCYRASEHWVYYRNACVICPEKYEHIEQHNSTIRFTGQTAIREIVKKLAS